jgi:peptide deformylase
LDSKEKDGPRDNPHVQMPLVMLNPKVTAGTGEQSNQEGCLSFPEIFVTITRPYEVTVSFTGLDNREKKETVRGLLARAVLHETDHLAGVLLVDRMSAIQKLAMATKLKRLKKETKAKLADSR